MDTSHYPDTFIKEKKRRRLYYIDCQQQLYKIRDYFFFFLLFSSIFIKASLTNATNIAELFTQIGHTQFVSSVSFSPDGKWIASGSEDNTVKIWNSQSGRLLRTIYGHKGQVYTVIFSPNGKWITSGSQDNTVKIWDSQSGILIRSFSGHEQAVTSVSFSPDGKWIASGSEDNTVKIWNSQSGKLIRSLSGHKKPVTSVSFSPDGKWIASGIQDRVVLSPDGKWIVSRGEDNPVNIWDSQSGKLIRSLSGHKKAVMSVSFSPDGRRIVSGSYDNTLKIWNSQSGKLIRSISSQMGLGGISLSPDGKLIASGSGDTVKIWDSQSGKLIRSLSGHKNVVRSVSYSIDGRRLVSGSTDSSIRLWDSIDGSLICTLHSFGPQDYITYTPLGYYVASEYSEQYASWRIGSMVYSFDQYSEQFNRPDLVIKALLPKPLTESSVNLNHYLYEPLQKGTIQMPSKTWRPKPYIFEKDEGIDVGLLTNFINYIEGDVRAYVTQIQQWTKGSTPYFENTWLIKNDFDNDGIKEILLSAPYLKRLDISTERGASVSTIQHGPVCPVSLFLFESKQGLFFPVVRKEMHSPEFFALEDFNSDGVKEIVVLENWCGAKICGKNVHVFRWSEHHWEELNLTDGASKYISESVHKAIRKSGVQLRFE